MKISKSVLKSPDLAKGIFESELKRASNFLVEVFAIKEPVFETTGEFERECCFEFKNRILKCLFNFAEVSHDLLTSRLILIEETHEDLRPLCLTAKTHEARIEGLLTHLENLYGIDFTPLDLNEKDPRILSFQTRDNVMKTTIMMEHDEGTFEVVFDSDMEPNKYALHSKFKYVILLD